MTMHHDDALHLANHHIEQLRLEAAAARLRRRVRRRASNPNIAKR
jgi:hypothetical protein